MMESDKIAILSRQLKELTTTIKQLGSAEFNAHYSMDKELKELKDQQNIIEQKLDKLIGDVSLVNSNDKLKTSYKDYSSEDIYRLHNESKMSWNTLATYLNCSVSTVRRKYKEYLYGKMGDDTK